MRYRLRISVISPPPFACAAVASERDEMEFLYLLLLRHLKFPQKGVTVGFPQIPRSARIKTGWRRSSRRPDRLPPDRLRRLPPPSYRHRHRRARRTYPPSADSLRARTPET